MEFKLDTRTVESVGAITTKKITLSPNAKAFKIIFGQIYPDIIKAIVRELFTNAWDSQKSAGTLDTPIDIHLPTKWEPFFSIRDYGTGMLPEQIDNVYSRVFESSKDNSNDEAGMFGMGSKTPLGYVDTFGIVSCVDGQFWAYDMFINDQGEPLIALKAQGETDLPNGVEVSVGVKEDDENAFKTYAEIFALNSGAAVNINRQRVLNKTEPMMSGDGWILQQPCDYDLMIRMGCVLYRIDPDFIVRGMDHSMAKLWRGWLSKPIIIDFDIGEFEVTGSREDIVYNSESINKIVKATTKVIEEITDQVDDIVNASTSRKEAYIKYYDFKELGFTPSHKAKWKSWHITDLRKSVKQKILRTNFMQVTSMTKKWKRESELNISTLYNKAIKKVYVVLDQDKPRSRTIDRINYIRSFAPSRDSFIIWVKGDKINPRLVAILPEHAIFINLLDIDAPKNERYVREKKDYDTCYKLKNGPDDDIRTTYSQTLFEQDGYYVLIGKNRRCEQPDDDVELSANALGVSLCKVNAILPNKIHLVQKYNLKDLIVEGKAARDNLDYDDNTYHYHAIKSACTGKFNGWKQVYSKSTEINSGVAILMGWKVDYKKAINQRFEVKINKTVEKKFKQFEKMVVDRLTKLYEDHPLLAYADDQHLRNDSEELLRKIGEIT